MPESPIKSPAKIDWAGAGMLSATLIALLVGVSEANSWGWGSPPILGLFAAAIVLGCTWVAFERRQAQPLVDIAMMRERAVATTNLTALLVGFGMFGSFILIPQLVQAPASSGLGFGASVTEAGLFMAAVGGDDAVRGTARRLARLALRLAPATPDRDRRRGRELRPLDTHARRAGSASIWPRRRSDSESDSHSRRWRTSSSRPSPPARTGVATGMNTIMRTIGGSLGGQIAASVVAAHVVLATGLPQAGGFELAFGISAVAMAGAFVAALAIPRHLAYSPDSRDAAAAVRPADPRWRPTSAGDP